MTIDLRLFLKPGGAKYRAISDALEAAVNSGALQPGIRLPTHRELAEQLNVSVQTVSNAYAMAEKKGIVRALVGSGTFVTDFKLEQETEFMLVEEKGIAGKAIDLSYAHPVLTSLHHQLFRETLGDIAQGNLDAMLFSARPIQGHPKYIEAAQQWLAEEGLPADQDRIVLCNSASQGLMLAMGAVLQPGEFVACEDLVDHGLIARARLLKVKPLGLPTDREGILPDAFEEACRRTKIKALCCTPSMSNPASTHMSLERRKAIADVARRYGVVVIEDDVYGALEPDRLTPISALLPEQAFYINSFAKIVAPGLRASYLVTPRHLLQHVIARQATTSWMATPMPFEFVSRWIYNGTMRRMVALQQQEFKERQLLAAEELKAFSYESHAHGMHLWLRLPEAWRSDEFVQSALKASVVITGYQPFVVSPAPCLDRVRISLGVESSRERLVYGLRLLASLLDTTPPPSHFL